MTEHVVPTSTGHRWYSRPMLIVAPDGNEPLFPEPGQPMTLALAQTVG